MPARFLFFLFGGPPQAVLSHKYSYQDGHICKKCRSFRILSQKNDPTQSGLKRAFFQFSSEKCFFQKKLARLEPPRVQVIGAVTLCIL